VGVMAVPQAVTRVGRRLLSSKPALGAKVDLASLSRRVNLKGKTVLLRSDLNVPMTKQDPPTITDATRIEEAVPTIQLLIDAGAKVVLCSHVGRPKGAPNDQMRLAPMAAKLSELLGQPVESAADCIGEDVERRSAALKEGGVLMLENLRFHKQEEKNDPEFAEAIVKSSGATIYVNDAFGTAHRAHASTAGVTKYVQHSVAGLLLQKELKYMNEAVLAAPKRPLIAIVGGSKVSSKLPVLTSLMQRCDTIVIGGAMCFTFLKSQGLAVGTSMVEEEQLSLAASLIKDAKAKGVNLLLPTDAVVAERFEADSPCRVVSVTAMPDGMMGLDIGPDSIRLIANELSGAGTVVWNGPMGVFEMEAFAKALTPPSIHIHTQP